MKHHCNHLTSNGGSYDYFCAAKSALTGNINITYRRLQFFKCNQLAGESFAVYGTALRTLALTCDFGDVQEDLIRDRIVCGLQNESLQGTLLQKKKDLHSNNVKKHAVRLRRRLIRCMMSRARLQRPHPHQLKPKR